ncbi:type 2 lantipeptide synthetase LanM [Xylanibacillus composti]|uniref:Lanthionine synthetase n=1 Tax=Xylanibacillus composti TaxID=1572762 RepID=A0A8J4H5L8_9BACL|nr:type 2 lanthipeptide synthetase LanM [Xylanibacillus composti]MDT9725351.1 type 2 lantipeptide synthetase LanM [Xylanibacillus composti]GIQ69113.1 lanthionine synthetase [Xylanibacillus composti]
MVTLKSEHPYRRASYVSERIPVAADHARPADCSAELASWMAKSRATEEEFETRLKSKGLSLQEFNRLLASRDIPTTSNTGWMEELERILNHTPDSWLAQHLHMGIGVFVLPFLHELTDRVRRWFPAAAAGKVLLDSVLQSLQNSHLRDLRMAADRTVVYVFHQAKEQDTALTIETFVARLAAGTSEIEKLLASFPVLARILTEMTTRAARNSKEMLERFLDDYDELDKVYFGGRRPRLQSVQMGEGDSHQDGRTVATLQFDCGLKLVYKPRSLETDIALAGWLHCLGHQGLRYPLGVPATIAKQQYGWQQFVEHRPCVNEEEVRRYYYRMGVLCGVFLTLQSTDMHYENIVACGDMPYVIDNETLLANNIYDEEKLHFPLSHLYRSVLLSGLVPTGQLFQSRIDFDLSGIAGKPEQTSTNMKGWILQQEGTDEIKFAEVPFVTKQAQHLVRLEGEIVDPVKYVPEIGEGFADVYRILARDKEAAKREIRERFGRLTGRALLRPTYLYARFLTASQHPQYLQDGLDREKLLEMLWNITKGEKAFEQIVPAEIADLLHHDIPYFTFDVKDTCLYTSSKQRIPAVFRKSSLQWIEERLDRYGEEDLAFQLRLLKYAIHSAHVGGMELPEAEALDHPSPVASGRPFEPLAMASDIADYLIEHRLADDEHAAWIGLRNHDNQFRMAVLDFSIYSGTLGISMFLGLMYGETKNPVYRDAAVQNFRYVLSVFDRMGDDELLPSVFNGRGAVAYAGFFLHAIWGFPEAREAALAQLKRIGSDSQASHIPEHAMKSETQSELDFLDGCAGIVTLSIHIWERFREPQALEAARMSGQRLCGLLSRERVNLTGFAHGSSGLLYALGKLERHGLLPEESGFIPALLQFENAHYDKTKANWKDLRSHAAEPFAAQFWCHGAPGVLLGRSEGHVEQVEAAEREKLLRSIIERTSANPRLSLCHGVFGNIDILLSLMDKPEWRPLRSVMEEAVWRLAARPDIPGKIQGMKERGLVGLMLGVAGIGWTCLRLARAGLPSALTLQFPAEAAGSLRPERLFAEEGAR